MVTCCIYDSFYNGFEALFLASAGKPRANHGQTTGIPRAKKGPIGSVVLIPEENIVLISEESNGFMSITEKLINYKENWKWRFSPKMQVHLQISLQSEIFTKT